MKFKIGDVVRVKKDLNDNDSRFYINSVMRREEGKLHKIVTIHEDEEVYCIDDDTLNCWEEYWLELVITSYTKESPEENTEKTNKLAGLVQAIKNRAEQLERDREIYVYSSESSLSEEAELISERMPDGSIKYTIK